MYIYIHIYIYIYIYIYIQINFLKKGRHPSNQRMQSKANSNQKDKSKGNSENKLFLEDKLKLTGFVVKIVPSCRGIQITGNHF